MTSQPRSWSSSRKTVYIVVMMAAGIIAFVVTWQATGSLWWGLLALLLAGSVMQIVRRIVGLVPQFPQTHRPAGSRSRGAAE